jgi:DNA polymerase
MNKVEKEQALQELCARMNTPEKCPLYATAKNVVPGEGNVDADIMFIGEAPGRNEDEQGRPFVGAAGKFLTQLIESIGLKREDVYIANIIKHRPPANRDPLPEEITAYAPWLDEQINIINPKMIATLGRFSMDYLLTPGFSISQIHGQPKRRNGRVIMPLYHPAAALYRGDLRPALAADFAKIPKVLELVTQERKTQEDPAQQKPLL